MATIETYLYMVLSLSALCAIMSFTGNPNLEQRSLCVVFLCLFFFFGQPCLRSVGTMAKNDVRNASTGCAIDVACSHLLQLYVSNRLFKNAHVPVFSYLMLQIDTFGDIPVQYLNGIDLGMMFRVCEVI